MSDRNPLIEVGGQGPLLHFAHANGYPPECYRAFLEPFTESFRVVASRMRPLWTPPPDPGQLSDWTGFADELTATLDALENRPDGGVVGVGHSLGGFVSLIAAARRPDLFRSLVLIEPPFLLRWHRMALHFFRHLAPQRFPMVARTLERRDHWDSVDEAFRHFRAKRVFRRIRDDVLEDYARYGTRLVPAPADDPGSHHGRELVFDKQWEARIYLSLANHEPWLRRCRVPVVALRGAVTDTLMPSVWQRWQVLAPHHHFIEVPGVGHLLPFEQPEVVAGRILTAPGVH